MSGENPAVKQNCRILCVTGIILMIKPEVKFLFSNVNNAVKLPAEK
jgi:hypothetical protein